MVGYVTNLVRGVNEDQTLHGSEISFPANTQSSYSRFGTLTSGRIVLLYQYTAHLFANGYNPDMTSVYSGVQVTTSPTFPIDDSFDIGALTNGKWVAVYRTSIFAISAQIFNADFTKSGSEFQVNTRTSTYQTGCYVAVLGLQNGNFIAFYQYDTTHIQA